jgi:hypothetical protein
MKTGSYVKTLLWPLMAVFASILASPAQAIPVQYSVSYDASTAGPSGTGSFSWDSDTHQFSGFSWDFLAASGTLMSNDWRASIFGGTMGAFLFEILTGEDLHPSACTATSRCTFISSNIASDVLGSVLFRSLGTGLTEYVFRNGGNVLYRGTLSINRLAVAVSEPVTLLLLSAGLLGVALRRRKPLG